MKNHNSSGLSQIFQKRLVALQEHINQNYELIQKFEVIIRTEDNPKKILRYQIEINDLRDSIINFKNEFDQIKEEIKENDLDNTAILEDEINTIDKKLDLLISGQERIRDEILAQEKLILSKFKSQDEHLIKLLLSLNEKEKIPEISALIEATENGLIKTSEINDLLNKVDFLLEEILNSNDSSKLVMNEGFKKVNDYIDDAHLDTNYKFKLTLPIIPLLLNFETELGIKGGLNLDMLWEKMIKKLRRIE